jgi:hypothetical protein
VKAMALNDAERTKRVKAFIILTIIFLASIVALFYWAFNVTAIDHDTLNVADENNAADSTTNITEQNAASVNEGKTVQTAMLRFDGFLK